LSISINNYCRVHKDVPEASINDIQALRYEKGGHYKLHIDDGGNTYRRISQILYLNNDYEGGNLIFESTDGKDKKVVEPKAGRIITWPSNFLFRHGIEPITKGVRHSIVSWAV
jgi:predicted 2-oxoglutarate/Fe(II)-dependent dioxygenase YbiX